MTHRTSCARRTAAVVAVAIAVSGLAACSSGGGSGDEGAAPGPTTTAATPTADVVLRTGDEGVTATLDERFQSYNIERVEVTGGTFWAPYDAAEAQAVREPIDLGSERLRNLARALGPVYIRVSGSKANSTYFDPDGTAGATPPDGFDAVLTGDQWQGVGDFAEAVDGQIVTSFASNDAVRDAGGVWQDDQARALLEFTADHDIPLVAAEFYNEPSIGIGAPADYDAESFGRDIATFQAVVDEVLPDLRSG